MGDGGNSLPRPPRRIPPSAGTLTQLEAGSPRSPQPPTRRPWLYGRFLAGLIVLLIIVAAGATAGWYLRAHSLRIDTADVQDTAGHAVVRVLATTCAGTGQASGVLTDDGLILTATSAVEQPLSTVVVTPDNRIRRANLLGVSTDGVAVLRLIGSLDADPIPLAGEDPDPKAERALIGYTAAGKQTIQPVGSVNDPTPLSTVMNTEKLGGPVVDKAGQVVGLVVGDTVQASTIVGVEKLRVYVVPRSKGITAEAGGSCAHSRGPQNGVVPELQVAGTPLATEVQQVLGNYLTLENKRDFPALQALYSTQLAKTITVAKDRRSHETTYFFGPKLIEVSPYGTGAYARLTFNALFSPNATGAGGRSCNRLDYRYRLVREDGKLVIDTAVSMAPAQSCETE